MFGMTKTSAPETAHCGAPHLESWTPPEVVAAYEDVAPSVRESLTPISAADWLRELRGDDRTFLGLPTTPDPTRGPLGAHVKAAIAARDFNGIVPGTLTNPRDKHSYAYAVRPGREDKTFQQLVPQLVGPTIGEVESYERITAARPAFEAEVESTVAEVLGDTERAWAAYLHLATIHEARIEMQRRADELAQRRREDRIHRCPICQQLNGHIEARAIEPDYNPRPHSSGVKIRSCIPCWHEARARQQERRSAELVSTGQTRAALIAAWLDEATEPVAT